ncbi:histidine kinase [Niabella terrae]
MSLLRRLFLLVMCFFYCYFQAVRSQPYADDWKSVSARKSGSITVYWNEIEPFIYRNEKGQLIGVEYELMEGFRDFVQSRYGVDLQLNWKEFERFDQIYPEVRDALQPGIFAVSYYSITEARKNEVKFSPPYMPDLNVLVSHNDVPLFTNPGKFKELAASMQGFTQPGTTMQQDLEALRRQYYPDLPITHDKQDDYSVLNQVARNKFSIAYVPLSIYVVALQRGIKVKRQRLFDVRREGFAAIYPKISDWDEPIQQYFNAPECKTLIAGLIRKYLGEEVSDIILEVSDAPATSDRSKDIDLLTKEREIVTQRFMKQAAELEQQQSLQQMVLLALVCLSIFVLLIWGRFRMKHKLNRQLTLQNRLISDQNLQIGKMNRLLQLKILQARMNPHFLFNSLSSIQYFILQEDKQVSLKYISRFSKFLRKLIRYGDELAITAAHEAELLEEYLWLEQTRFPGRFHYTVEMEEDAAGLKILPLLTHCLIEKLLYEDLLHQQTGPAATLDIRLRQQDGWLRVTMNCQYPDSASAHRTQRKPVNEIDPEKTFYQRIDLYNEQHTEQITVHQQTGDAHHTIDLLIPQPLQPFLDP